MREITVLLTYWAGRESPWTDDPGTLISSVHLTAPLENSTDSLFTGKLPI